MFVISMLLVIPSQLVLSVLSKPSKCRSNEYYDKFINMCQSCDLCCPPRPTNEFCRRHCNLKNLCFREIEDFESLNDNNNDNNINFNDNIAYIILAFVIFLVVGLIVVVSIFVFRKYFKTKIKNTTTLLGLEQGETSLKQAFST